MEVKKYKVVCSQPKFSDKIYIDIAPDGGIIHDQIFFSRIMLHKQVNSEPLSRLYGSIYLQDNNGNISVEFPAPQVRKDSPEYEGIMRQYGVLEQKIIKRYKEMSAAGQTSTLFVYGVSQMFELSEAKNAEGDAFERRRRERMKQVEEQTKSGMDYKQKHAQKISSQGPQTPQEEQRMQYAEEFAAIQRRRVAAEQKRSNETVPAWRQFQKQYSGD